MASLKDSVNNPQFSDELETYFDAARIERTQLPEDLKLAILEDAISVQKSFVSSRRPADSGHRVLWWTELLNLFGGWRSATALALSALVGVGSGLALAETVASLASAVPEAETADLAPDIYSGLEVFLQGG